MKKLLLLALLLSFNSFALEEHDILRMDEQDTAFAPFTFPISINHKGEVDFFGKNGDQPFAVGPSLHLGISTSTVRFIEPLTTQDFEFRESEKNLNWYEVKKFRYEFGLGLDSKIVQSANFSLGLAPYKGAYRTMIRRIKDANQKKTKLVPMPQKLSELNVWSEGDYGSYQTYGGIQFFASASFSGVGFMSGRVGTQNSFLVEMRKINPKKVILTISEETSRRKELDVGPMVVKGTIGRYTGHRLVFQFRLNPEIAEHHALFEKALAGELDELQEKLVYNESKLKWVGHEGAFYYGVPWLIGKNKYKAKYELVEDEIETELTVLGDENKGFILPMRVHRSFVYQSEQGLVFYWLSEMTRTNRKAMEENFFKRGRALGLKGFDAQMPEDLKLGSVIAQLGLGISKDELMKFGGIDLVQLEADMKIRCEQIELKCAKAKHLKEVIADFKALTTKPWDELKSGMGVLLVKEPALIQAIVKALQLSKRVYYKFLSESYQSLQGTGAIEI